MTEPSSVRRTQADALPGSLLAPGSTGCAAPDAVLDPVALERLAELDPRGEGAFVRKVLSTFQSSAARLAGELVAARASGDAKTIGRIAHTIKSSAGYIGATELACRCGELEAEAKIQEKVGGRDLVPGIEAMNAALAIALTAVARRLNP